MHAAGIQLDHAFFIRKPAQSDAVIIGIILWTGNHQDGGVQRVASFGQMIVGAIEIGEAVVRAHDDGTLRRSRSSLRISGLAVLLPYFATVGLQAQGK